jgi:hypothetical protein
MVTLTGSVAQTYIKSNDALERIQRGIPELPGSTKEKHEIPVRIAGLRNMK